MPNDPFLHIRAACLTDVPAITGIYVPHAYEGTATFEIAPPAEAEMQRRFLAIIGAGFPYLVAEANGAVVAFAYANSFRPRPAFRYTVEDSIYVAAASHSRGIGSALLERLCVVAEALGFRQMVAVIGDSCNQRASIRLHERAGFRRCGQVEGVGFKMDRWLDVVFMQRALGPGITEPPRVQT